MASVPPSVSDSGNATPHSPKNQVEGAINNGVFQADEKKPDFADGLDHLDSTQCIERFRNYEREYSRRLVAKYFSDKGVYGGNLFDVQIPLGDEVVKSSRLFADPVVGYEDQCSNGSSPPAETQGNIANGKHMLKN